MSRRFPLAITLGACLLGLGLGLGCGPERHGADLVVRGGRVYTLDEARSWAEAVAVDGGEIVYVGSDEEAAAYVGPETRVLELDGEMVLPGFHDSHVHLVTGGVELAQCDLNGLATKDEVLDALQAFASSHPDEDWIVGGGWDLPIFPAASPHRSELDRLVPDRPAYLSSADGHSAWVNSRALELAGLDASTPDPPKGRIEREPGTREPAGTLREAAMELVSRHLPPLTVEDRVEGLKRALRMANGFGITSVIEANGTDPVLEAYARLADSSGLTARVRVSLSVVEGKDESQVDALIEKRERHRAAPFRVDAAKIFADGVIEARTAALLEPYVGLEHRGELNFEPEALQRIVTRLDAEGFQVHVHAIGDRAIRASLDAFEKAGAANPPRDRRHHIAHIELFHPDDVPRFRELGVVANFQPLWAYADSYITELTEPALGEERSRWLYPIQSLAESGAVLAAGSDWSVSSMNPLDAIQVALTRRALEGGEEEAWIPEECSDLDTLLSAYTRGGAYLQYQESLTGSIEPGKRADLAVLERNLFQIPPEEIHRVKVLLTLLDGVEVYRADGFSR